VDAAWLATSPSSVVGWLVEPGLDVAASVSQRVAYLDAAWPEAAGAPDVQRGFGLAQPLGDLVDGQQPVWALAAATALAL
jgi:hypothetical protein